MKQLPLFLLCSLFINSISWGQSGQVYDNLTLESKILKGDRKFAIYLPPGYNSSQRSYPVLYLLHGMGDDHSGWVQFGEVLHITDKAIKEGSATPMIIVMPDANTGQVGYFNRIEKKWDYEDFFFKELMPFVESNYRIKKEKRYRAISGLSMGGGGTMMYALHHPELFSSACPLSAYMGPKNLEEYKRFTLRDSTASLTAKHETHYRKHNALSLIEDMSQKDISSVRWYIDCGDDDFLFEGNSLVHIALKKKKVPHEYRVRDGAHNWTYWRASLEEVLKFVSQGFHQY